MKGDIASAAARLLGQIGGKSRSRRKQDAARENGKLGGWPKGRKRGTESRRKSEPVRELVCDPEFSQEG